VLEIQARYAPCGRKKESILDFGGFQV